MGRKKLTDEQKRISREKRLQYLRNYQKEHWQEYYKNNKEKILAQQKKKKEEIKGSPLREYNKVNLKEMNEQEKKEYYNQKVRESRARKKRLKESKKAADKIFKELGFYKRLKPKDDELLLFYVRDSEYIMFYKDKTISVCCNDKNYIVVIDMEIIKAINLKCYELGWL